MVDETAKIRIKLDQIEVEYEGAPSFIEDNLLNMLRDAMELFKDGMPQLSDRTPNEIGNGKKSHETGDKLDLSTNTIATKMGCKTGADLIVAAAACLTLVQGKDRFHRKDVLAEMQTASSFFKVTYTNNLTTYLDGLMKSDRLRLVAENTYAISAKEKEELEQKLAE